MNKGKLQYRGRYTIAFPLLGIAILWVSLAGCTAHYPINPSEGYVDRQLQYQLKKTEQARSDEVFMVLCFSGGGTRAASMSYGVLEALQAINLPARPTVVQAQGRSSSTRTLLVNDIGGNVSVKNGQPESAAATPSPESGQMQ